MKSMVSHCETNISQHEMNIAILLMAHGAPRNLDEVEEYVLHIRHGRPLPDDQMNAIKERYKLVGGSPLLDRTFKQATALCQKFPNSKVYLGMRHSSPFIKDTITEMKADGVSSFIAICMTPQFSKMSIGAYEEALKQAISESQSPMNYNLVRSFARHPKLIKAFATKVREVITNRSPCTQETRSQGRGPFPGRLGSQGNRHRRDGDARADGLARGIRG